MAILIYGVVLDPSFVSSFVYSDNVYFFFRETAVENINCGKVSAVCKCLILCRHCQLFSSAYVCLIIYLIMLFKSC